MLKITCCEECRRKRRLCRCKPSIQSVVPHDANNGSREALRPQSGAVPQAAHEEEPCPWCEDGLRPRPFSGLEICQQCDGTGFVKVNTVRGV